MGTYVLTDGNPDKCFGEHKVVFERTSILFLSPPPRTKRSRDWHCVCMHNSPPLLFLGVKPTRGSLTRGLLTSVVCVFFSCVFVLCFEQTALRSELPKEAELVLAHFKNCLDETPYCVAVDHTWQSIIITIRGTHSFEVGGCVCIFIFSYTANE